MKYRVLLLVVVLAVCLVPTAAWAEKCTRILPAEVLEFFGDERDSALCDAYEYRLIDLNDDQQLEVYVTNYRKSCVDVGFCNVEFFEKREKRWVHIATISGRVNVTNDVTKGYHDIAGWLLGKRYLYKWDGTTYHDAGGPVDDKNSKKNNEATPKP